MNIIDAIKESAMRNPAAPALIQGDQVLNYRQLYALICHTARILHQRGVRPGDVVGMSLGQVPRHCIVMLALARLGAVSVPVHPLASLPDKEAIISKYGVRTLIVFNADPGYAGVATIKLNTFPPPDGHMDMGFTDYVPDAHTPFRISLSSGTTGGPKGVLFTHGYLLDRIEKTLHECDDKSRVIPFDLNFALGFIFAIGVLINGGVVILTHKKKMGELAEAINLYGVTHVSIPPVAVVRMNAFLTDEGTAFPTLKHLRIVGGAISKSQIDNLLSKFSPNVFLPYGLTEIGAVSLATPDMLSKWPESSGKVQSWVKVEIVNAQDERVAPGESGEIRVQVEGMPTEYVNDAEQSALKFRNGWFYSGDSGRLSEEGLLFIEGRTDDMINLDGHKANPGHIEGILSQHPQVKESVVFALENRFGVKELVAAIIPHVQDIKLDDLKEFAKKQLGLFFPKRFFVMQDFPRTLNGKIIRDQVMLAAHNIRNAERKEA